MNTRRTRNQTVSVDSTLDPLRTPIITNQVPFIPDRSKPQRISSEPLLSASTSASLANSYRTALAGVTTSTQLERPPRSPTSIPTRLLRPIDEIMDNATRSDRSTPEASFDNFSSTPMGALLVNYNEDGSDGTLSLYNRMLTLTLKRTLDPSLVEDRGISVTEPRPPYAVRYEFLRRIEGVVSDLQALLEKAVALIPSRTSYFRVDPEASLMPILRGCYSLTELSAAWEILRLRMELGHRSFLKYVQEFKGFAPLSPVSTDPGLYSTLPNDGNEPLLLHYFRDVPHHNQSLPRQTRETLNYNRALADVLPEPISLKQAFPLREPSRRPSIVTYDEDGKKRERHLPLGSSYRNSEWTLPNIKNDIPTRDKGKKKASFDPTSIPLPDSDEPMSPRRPDGFEYVPDSYRVQIPRNKPWISPPPSLSALLSQGTHFQRSGLQISGIGDTGLPQHTSSVSTRHNPANLQPNMLYAMAVPNSAIPHSKLLSHAPTMTLPPATTNYNTTFPKPLQGGGRSPPRNSDPTLVMAQYYANSGSKGPPGGSSDGGNSNDPPPPPLGPNSPNYGPRPPSPLDGGGGGGGGGGPPNSPGGGGNGNGLPDGRTPPGRNDWLGIATIKSEYKPEELPSWDGDGKTAVRYFFEVQEMAGLGGTMPWALGANLWRRLDKKSEIRWWFGLLEPTWKDYMRQHYTHFLSVIKVYWLGDAWQQDMNLQFDAQRFRQHGHENETPQAYIMCRLLYARMLTVTDQGGPLEIHTIMKNAPISWRTILVIGSIPDTTTLIRRVMDHQDALLHAAITSIDNFVTKDSLHSLVRHLNPSYNSNRSTRTSPGFNRRAITGSSANFVSLNESKVEGAAYITEVESQPQGESQNAIQVPDDSTLVSEAYAVLKKRQRPPPKDGYPFQKNDHISTKMGRLPPSPCKICGSSNHWDRECSDFDAWIQMQKKNGNAVEVETSGLNIESVYNQAYEVLMVHRLSSLYLDCERMAESCISEMSPSSILYVDKSRGAFDLDLRERLTDSHLLYETGAGYSSPDQTNHEPATSHETLVKSSYRVSVEEIEDESVILNNSRLIAVESLLEEITPSDAGGQPLFDSHSELLSSVSTNNRNQASKHRVTIEEVEDEYHV